MGNRNVLCICNDLFSFFLSRLVMARRRFPRLPQGSFLFLHPAIPLSPPPIDHTSLTPYHSSSVYPSDRSLHLSDSMSGIALDLTTFQGLMVASFLPPFPHLTDLLTPHRLPTALLDVSDQHINSTKVSDLSKRSISAGDICLHLRMAISIKPWTTASMTLRPGETDAGSTH